jgi:hypothetical protein
MIPIIQELQIILIKGLKSINMEIKKTVIHIIEDH